MNRELARLPRIHGKIDEEDWDNNTGVGEFYVYAPVEATITPAQTALSVTKMSVYQEEEPIIPFVFFDVKSTDIDERFNRMLSIVASRLATNPDATLLIRGYYSQYSEGDTLNGWSLAQNRAESVKSRLVQSHGDIICFQLSAWRE